ncbi:alpha/beta fold hydrolase [Nocardioides sp. GCM10027113]|uniref:alpha/beta fold hydrolase n=1 Tax=unclassified Nocardioides TaxID=2615069 RepID=UPI003608543C
MSTASEADVRRVTSPDGTALAVYVSGRGRPLVVVPGSTNDHSAWDLVVPLLARRARVHVMDRRGYGHSDDGDPADPYDITREYADVAAVVESAATDHGGPIDLLGHSYGGNLCFGAVGLTSRVRRLVLYEGWPVPNPAHRASPPELLAELDGFLHLGLREAMLRLFYREVVGRTEEEIAQVEASPGWAGRVAAAHAVPRELRAFASQAFDPAAAARIGIPVLMLVGELSPAALRADPEVVAAALPDARIRELAGQAHTAHLADPEALAAAVLEFLAD